VKLPRNLNAQKLISSLKRIGYKETRQSGSHIRLTKTSGDGEHHITIPNHSPIKIGTLNNILQNVSHHLKISKEELILKLKI
jgi:predicted RNA binding protein YcfA (HicA-like mRNA interferase family)